MGSRAGRKAMRRTAVALLLTGAVIASSLLTAGCLSLSARASVARAYRAYQTVLDAISGADIMDEITELSSPAYAGRQAGSPGGKKAADHIAGRYAAIGLAPLFGDSYFQEFTIAYSHPGGAPEARLYEAAGRDVGQLAYGQDIAYGFWSDSAAIKRAPVVLVGGWDRIGAADLTGKVALALRPQEATFASLYTGLEQAKQAGAVALLAADFDPATVTSYWDVDTYVSGIAMAGLSTPATELLLQRTGKNLASWYGEIAAAAKAGRDFTPVDTGLTIDFAWSIDNDHERAARNVIGVIPGARGLADSRSVLLTAHYDHLGSLPGGPIWPGAWDNSSGVAVMLAAARAIAEAQPDINVIVAAWDAEERGLVGSAYFAGHTPAGIGPISGIINLDCIGARLDFSLERSRAGQLTHCLTSAASRFDITMDETTVKPWSDAASFQSDEAIEAIQIFDAGDPYQVPFLHDPSDTTANLKTDALERIARTVALAIIAGGRDSGAK